MIDIFNTIDWTKNYFIFNNKNVLVAFRKENGLWFEAKDIVVEILQYKDTKQAIRNNVVIDDKTDFKTLCSKGVRNLWK